jgi:hypothetical protein
VISPFSRIGTTIRSSGTAAVHGRFALGLGDERHLPAFAEVAQRAFGAAFLVGGLGTRNRPRPLDDGSPGRSTW